MVKSIIKLVVILSGIDLILFVAMIIMSMTDETPSLFGQLIHWLLKYIAGFPIVFVNNHYPFFLEEPHIPIYAIVLVLTNNIVLSVLVKAIKMLFK